MAGGYAHDQKGIDAVVAMVRDLQRQIDSIRGAAGIKSAILRGDKIEFQDADGNLLAQIGEDVRFNEFSNTHTGLTTFDPANGEAVFHSGRNDHWDAVGIYVFDSNGAEMFIVHDLEDGSGRYAAFGGGESLEWFTANASGAIFLLSDGPTGQVILRGTQGVYIDGIGTTASAANMNITANGLVRQVSSARKYKAEIEPAEVNLDDARAFLNLGRTWIDRGELDRDPNYSERVPGSIAEELDALPSLRQFVVYDEDGKPDAISYDRLYVALLPLLKHLDDAAQSQAAEIDDLKSTVASLEARLEALEARA